MEKKAKMWSEKERVESFIEEKKPEKTQKKSI